MTDREALEQLLDAVHKVLREEPSDTEVRGRCAHGKLRWEPCNGCVFDALDGPYRVAKKWLETSK